MVNVQQVLVAFDRSAMSEEALRRAVCVAQKKKAQLIVVHVIEPPFIASPYLGSIDEKAIRDDITLVVERVIGDAQVEHMLFLEYGEPADAIRLQVKKTQADLIVVGSHGKEDLQSDHLGTTTLKLIQRCRLPVIIVKRAMDHPYQKMIAPTNLSEHSKECVLFARHLYSGLLPKYLYAAGTISDLQALTYHIGPEQRDDLRKKMALKAKHELELFVDEVGGGEMALIDYKASVNEDLLTYILDDDAELLVLGSNGVESLLFSSTASYLLQRSPIDVLVYVP